MDKAKEHQSKDLIRNILGDKNIIEVCENTPLPICERRDEKALYKQVRNSEIKDFAGFNSLFKIPECPDRELRTVKLSVESLIKKINNIVLLFLHIRYNTFILTFFLNTRYQYELARLIH